MTKIDIITFATGYPFFVYDRFIGSLNDTGFSGKVFIVVKEQDNKTMDLVTKKYSNVVLFYDTIHQNTHINNHRFFCLEKLLENAYFESEYLFMCDFRDVLFQRNIEEYDFSSDSDAADIYGFQEELRICDEKVYNTPWIQMLGQILGEDIFAKIGNNPIICCGTTLGKIEVIKKYVSVMCQIINSYRIQINLDQAIHNYLLYMNKLGVKVAIFDNNDIIVNTAGQGERRLNAADQIINKIGEVPYIVHQYDRFPAELRRRFSKKYNFAEL